MTELLHWQKQQIEEGREVKTNFVGDKWSPLIYRSASYIFYPTNRYVIFLYLRERELLSSSQLMMHFIRDALSMPYRRYIAPKL